GALPGWPAIARSPCCIGPRLRGDSDAQGRRGRRTVGAAPRCRPSELPRPRGAPTSKSRPCHYSCMGEQCWLVEVHFSKRPDAEAVLEAWTSALDSDWATRIVLRRCDRGPH